MQNDINRETAKVSALSSGKIGKYEYLLGEEILLLQQHRVIQEAKFTCSPHGKALEKQIKPNEEHCKKQVQALKSLESLGKELPPIKKLSQEECSILKL